MRRVVLAVLVAAAFVGACGGDKLDDQTMTVTGAEMSFDAPNSVPAGNYRVTFINNGNVQHELAFKDPSGKFVARNSVAPHQTVLMQVKISKKGTWDLGCYEPGHYEAGMHKPLVVE